MTNAAWLFMGIVWVTLGALAGLFLMQRSPRRRKPVDELEAADAALRNRILDLEDKYESFVKRLAVRDMRAKKEQPEQENPPGFTDKASRLAAVQQRVNQLRRGA